MILNPMKLIMGIFFTAIWICVVGVNYVYLMALPDGWRIAFTLFFIAILAFCLSLIVTSFESSYFTRKVTK